MNYNNLYKKKNNAWGIMPNQLLQIITDILPAKSDVLDLGSAQGRDALYLASLGFNATAVEISAAGHEYLLKNVKDKKINNIEAINCNISDFEISKNKFTLISLLNSLQFLPKEKVLKLINKVKDALPPNGLAVISAFTTDDPSFINSVSGIVSHFDKQELLKSFTDFEIVYYFEKKILDPGHASYPKPHYHGAAKLIAKKI